MIDYINLSKVLDNYIKRCKCTGGESRGGIWLAGGGHKFIFENISSIFLLLRLLSNFK